MAECERCGEETSMPFRCKFCEGRFCSSHRLPENHECEGLENYKKKSKEEGKIGYDVMREDAERETSRPVKRTARRVEEILPSRITYIILLIMFVTFLMEVMIPGFSEAFALDSRSCAQFPNALTCPGTLLGEPWRLFTSLFLHAGLTHLLVNSIVLFSFGLEAERILGKARFIQLLLVSGLASSLGFALSGYLFGIGPAVGISGALYGMVTFLAVVRPNITVLAFFVIPLRIRHAIGFFAVMDAVNFVAHALGRTLPLIGGFASAGHLSGLLAGLVIGYLWKDRYSVDREINLFDLARL